MFWIRPKTSPIKSLMLGGSKTEFTSEKLDDGYCFEKSDPLILMVFDIFTA